MNNQKKQNFKWLWWILGIVCFFVIIGILFNVNNSPVEVPILPTAGQSVLSPITKLSEICINFEYSDWTRCTVNGTQSRTLIKSLPEGCIGGNSALIQNCIYNKDIGPKWDYVSLTPEIFNKIIQKIKSAPNSEIKSTKFGEQGSITFYYSFVAHDSCEPLLKDYLVFELESTTYVDKNGQKYPDGPITDYYVMRDTDHDTYPEDYYKP